MSPLITGLLLAAVMVPWAQGQFPKACVNLQSLRSKTCCPVPKGFNEPCGSDENRGKCQDLIVREWNVSYSHYKDFQVDDDRHNWPSGLYNKICTCHSNFAGFDCSKCEYGFHGKNCDQKKTLTRKNFAKLSDDEKDRYMRYINFTRYELNKRDGHDLRLPCTFRGVFSLTHVALLSFAADTPNPISN